MEEKSATFTCPFCKKEHTLDVERCPETGEAVTSVYRMHGCVLIDKYKILKPIGEGGMGIVYEATQKNIDKKVAVKFLFPTIKASDEVMARFHNEAKVAASISHKNIRHILDMDKTPEGNPFIVMEYLEGRSLGKIIRSKGKLSSSTAARIALQILSALRGVHSMGIVHRDLKPDNVFITQQAGGEEIVKIVDFGISHLMKPLEGKDLIQTKDDAIVGTPKYLSPEQAASEKVDERTDLYAVGTILYEMVTGRHPFEEKNYNKIIVSILTREPEPPSTHNRDLPSEFETIILKAMKKEPYNRFQSADELAREIKRFLAESSSAETIPPITARDSAGRENGAEAPASDTARSGTRSAAAGAAGDAPMATSAAPSVLRGRKSGLLPAGLVALVAAAFLIAFFIQRNRDSDRDVHEPSMEAHDKGQGSKAAANDAAEGIAPPTGAQPEPFRVTLKGLPPQSSVYVDGVLHPEHPLALEPVHKVRIIKIEATGYEIWEKSVALSAHVELDVVLSPIQAKEKQKKQETPVKKDSKTGQKEKIKIDVEYPLYEKKPLDKKE
jgi:serine/threonine protein kinase